MSPNLLPAPQAPRPPAAPLLPGPASNSSGRPPSGNNQHAGRGCEVLPKLMHSYPSRQVPVPAHPAPLHPVNDEP
ncbi:MAG TPA: hypothetical protein PLL92_10465, partial [Alicycliphilus sp.]|nr:hypothetical protein [Alicycliphilus sp.]